MIWKCSLMCIVSLGVTLTLPNVLLLFSYLYMLLLKLSLTGLGNIVVTFCCSLLVNLCKPSPQFPVLDWQLRRPVNSAAAVVGLPRGSTCCVFTDGILYLNHYWVSFIFPNKVVHSQLFRRTILFLQQDPTVVSLQQLRSDSDHLRHCLLLLGLLMRLQSDWSLLHLTSSWDWH